MIPVPMGPQMAQKQCPNCGKVSRPTSQLEDAVANGGTAIQKEQHQTGICSDKCWDEFWSCLKRSYGPQMQFNDCIKQVVVENDISKVWREAANRPASDAGMVVRDFILTAAFAVYAEHLEQTAHHAFNRMPKRAVRTVAYAARNGDFTLARDTLSKYGVAY